jgi:hypothetical protein
VAEQRRWGTVVDNDHLIDVNVIVHQNRRIQGSVVSPRRVSSPEEHLQITVISHLGLHPREWRLIRNRQNCKNFVRVMTGPPPSRWFLGRRKGESREKWWICVNKGALADNDGQHVRTLEKKGPVERSRYDSPCNCSMTCSLHRHPAPRV